MGTADEKGRSTFARMWTAIKSNGHLILWLFAEESIRALSANVINWLSS